MKTFLIVFTFCCGWSFAADILDHPCRTTVPAKENFSTGLYAGVWFELYNNEHAFDGNCITHRYGRRGIQHVFDVDRSFIYDHVFYDQYTNVSVTNPEEIPMRAFLNGTAIYPDGTVNEYEYQVYATGGLNLQFVLTKSVTEVLDPHNQNRTYVITLIFLWNVNVILRDNFGFMDYSNYSLLWSCRSVGENQSIELVSILGRSKAMSVSVLGKADALLGLIGFSSENFRVVGHSDELCTVDT